MGIFVDGTIANFWNGTWLPLMGFAVATIATLLVLWRAPLTMPGLTARGLVILALLAAGPLAFYRAGLRVAIGDFEQIIESIDRRLFASLDADTIVMPGHGGDTTIGAEQPSLDEWVARGW